MAESQARHRALLSAWPDGVLLQSADGELLLASPLACDLLGLRNPDDEVAEADQPAEEPEERPETDTDTAHGSAIPGPRRPEPGSPLLDLVTAVAAATIGTGKAQRDVLVATGRDTDPRQLLVTATPIPGGDEPVQAVVLSFRTPDPRRTTPPTAPGGMPKTVPAPASRLGEDMFRQAMLHSPIGMAVTGLNGRFLRVNRTLCRMLGYRSDELQERTLFEILHPGDLEETSLQISRLLSGGLDAVTSERRLIGHGGMPLWGQFSATMVRDAQGRALHLVVQIEDVSPVHKAQELLTHMTLHDPLTGLANRPLVLDRIQKALDRSRRTERKVAVLQCDVDHFKVINDSAGLEQGDSVLKEVGRRVERALRAGDTAGRLGGDEFVIVCDDVADESDAIAVAERVQRSVHSPLQLGERVLQPTVSVGVALSTGPDADPLALLRDADIATYRAKERGRNRWDLVDGPLRRSVLERLDVEQTLRAAIAAGELQLHFQPIVDLTTRKVLGREALVRWQHPERGLLAPGLFLPVAEESGLIVEIGAWVLREATRAAVAATQAAATRAAAEAKDGAPEPGGPADDGAIAGGYVAVNVSPNQVSRPGLAETVEKSLAEAGLPAERLVIELTESAMLSSAPSARKEIAQLDELGVRLMVDDFGTGFSPLSYLRDLPVSGIKVDRSFTAGLGLDQQCDRIVEALTGLGQNLDLDVIVEGVETEEQRAWLAGIGAEHAQGYLFGRPGPRFDLTPA